MAVLHHATTQGEAQLLKEGAHRLRGATATLGAPRLALLLEDLADLGASEDLELARGVLERIDAQFGRSTAALRAVMPRAVDAAGAS